MVPFAIGTQTSGSVLRPASYCGITGLKPTYGLFSIEGVLPLAHSFDTLGFFTSTPEDMVLLWEALGRQAGPKEDIMLGVPTPVPATEPTMAAAFQNAISVLRNRGIRIELVYIAPMLEKLLKESNVVVYYEAARFHEERYRRYGARLLDVADVVKKGLEIPETTYRNALDYIAECKQEIAEQYRMAPVILVPAATGPAPLGLKSTGDSRMNRPWTALGTPAISIPIPVRQGMPLGLQLTAGHGQEPRLLQTAIKLAGILDSAA
jgi:Asp-tRNA(Asn)/Glu-tRNA(Gln) amidotransferase A subunit family amidase